MVVHILFDDDFFAVAFMMWVEGVEDPVSSLLDSVTERVVAAFVVVVTHLVSALVFFVNYNVLLLNVFFSAWTATLVFYVVCWLYASTIVVLGVVEIAVASIDLNVNFCVGVTVIVTLVAMSREFYFGTTLVSVPVFLVVVDDSLFLASRTAITILFVDTDFFLFVASTIFSAWKRC